MTSHSRKIAILGSTGSIGRSTLEVVRHSRGKLSIVALSAHRSCDELCRQAAEFRPRFVVVSDEEAARGCDWSRLPQGTELIAGPRAVERIVQLPEVEVVVAAVVGSAGLTGTWAALDAGKTVALANKETLVMAGPLVMRLAAERGAKILPVDSEHSAVFQLLDRSPHALREAGISRSEMSTVRRIILTASGGPFRNWTPAEMQAATVADALAHPTWQMGPKITVDSATMMNKALEIVEARWLFDLPPNQIDVVIHPQSIVHSLVEFADGSVLAQLSPPDMKLPIQYALTWPERCDCPARRLDLTEALRLDFEPPDEDRFPALALGREVAAAGGTAGAVLNAANEAAVAGFLAGELSFTEIVPACRSVLDSHSFSANPALDELLKLDAWARQEISRWICA
jgi:1-deoxy-D-xylulose-5-phosphate reductoisomerase